MEIRKFAERILYSQSLEDKLFHPDSLTDMDPIYKGSLPSYPARTKILSIDKPEKKRTPFPAIEKMHDPRERGKALHFFANHELLALELMALALLRFPNAPAKFRRGIVNTIFEEQRHMTFYLERMSQLGVEFGDYSLSPYFWNAMHRMKDPKEYVTQMSLTFEQANLDYCLYYIDVFHQVEDNATASILEKVYKDEIGHVKFGVKWFERWRPNLRDFWQEYQDHLPLPLSPARGKGIFFSKDARKLAGLNDEFIEKMQIYSRSKGKPPAVWWLNFSCEEEILKNSDCFAVGKKVAKLEKDLAHLFFLLANQSDVVVVKEKLRDEFIGYLRQLGFSTPEFICIETKNTNQIKLPFSRVEEYKPWGLSPVSLSYFKKLAENSLPQIRIPKQWEKWRGLIHSKLFSHKLSFEYLNSIADKPSWLSPQAYEGQICRELSQFDDILDRIHDETTMKNFVLKSPYGTSGRGMKFFRIGEKRNQNLDDWLKKVLKDQEGVLIEPRLEVVADLSVQIMIHSNGTKIKGITRFYTSPQGQYTGHFIGPLINSFDKELTEWFYKGQQSRQVLGFLKSVGDFVGKKLLNHGYQGPCGIDCMIFRGANNKYYLRPIVEVNARWTMGHLSLELGKKIKRPNVGLWHFMSASSIEKNKLSSMWEQVKQHPSGVLGLTGDIPHFLNDPLTAQGILSLLFVAKDYNTVTLQRDAWCEKGQLV